MKKLFNSFFFTTHEKSLIKISTKNLSHCDFKKDCFNYFENNRKEKDQEMKEMFCSF